MSPIDDRDALERRFRAAGTSFGEIEGLVAGIPGAGSYTMAVVGSYVDGYPTRESDVDLLAFGVTDFLADGKASFGDFGVSTLFARSGIEVSIESLSAHTLHALDGRMAHAVATIDDPVTADGLVVVTSPIDRKWLHRVRTAVPLRPADQDGLAGLRARLRSDRYPEVFALGCGVAHFSEREKAIALGEAGHVEAAAYSLGLAAQDLAGAVLAVAGYTHHSPLWRARRLREVLPDSLAGPLIDAMLRPIEADLTVSLVAMDEAILDLAVRMSSIVSAAERLSTMFPLRTHIEVQRRAKSVDELRGGSGL